jgi:hypothetical protein
MSKVDATSTLSPSATSSHFDPTIRAVFMHYFQPKRLGQTQTVADGMLLLDDYLK